MLVNYNMDNTFNKTIFPFSSKVTLNPVRP